MTEPSRPRPVPGPPRPGPGPWSAPATVPGAAVEAQPPASAPDDPPFGDLAHRPVTEHVAVFEAEHVRLQRELATIDQL
ncbi:hypothetical protein SAMN04488085_10310 [Geodermatophilus ruber]|uniref:Uncharacterized protein n=1 Tax=Geodermatophilus ruber TaxID=504800 RepID=A0A1I4BEP4_9ACTN|nr:hypothetical protein SAMN04488085_10310 [Geodermatophilus ruber]